MPSPFSPELSRLKIGYMPLVDAAPLIWARQAGHFSAFGLDVQLEREVSWASLRDRLAYGALDAAQCLAPMPLAAHLAIDGVGVPMVSAMSLSRGGSSVTLSTRLMDRHKLWGAPPLTVARSLAAAVARGEPLRFGHVFAWSMHHYLLRDWLSLGSDGVAGEAPDWQFVVAPPPQMVQLLESGAVDAFCAGEPWNLAALRGGLGAPVVASRQVWAGAPEKVLAVTRSWAAEHPQTHRALVAALLCAQREIAREQPLGVLARLLAEQVCPSLPEARLREALEGKGVDAPEFAPAISQLRPSQMLWCLLQMLRWRQLKRPVAALAAARDVCDTATYRDAATAAGMVPSACAPQVEGAAGDAAEAFLAGPALDPDDPRGWLIARGADEGVTGLLQA